MTLKVIEKWDEYQKWAKSTAVYPGDRVADKVSYVVLGLSGEAGELANIWKKALRDDWGDIKPERREALKLELGDIAWYLVSTATELGLTMTEVLYANVEKLTARMKDGTLHGR